jgi:GTP-binding protein Era
MNRAVTGSIETADLILLVVEGCVWEQGDLRVLDIIRESAIPCILVVNKVDRVKPRERLLPYLGELAERFPFVEIVPVSAKQSVNLQRLKELLPALLPVCEPLYSADVTTDRDVRFRAAEIIREKLMQTLRQEVPYGVGVEINELEEDKSGRLFIDAIIWVDRETHKGMVVGQGGQQIKRIGQAARLDLQATLGCSVHLESHVRVKRNWADSAQALRQLGYDH